MFNTTCGDLLRNPTMKKHRIVKIFFQSYIVLFTDYVYSQDYSNNSNLGYDPDGFGIGLETAIKKNCRATPTIECVLQGASVDIVKATCGKIKDETNKLSCLGDANRVAESTIQNLQQEAQNEQEYQAAKERKLSEAKRFEQMKKEETELQDKRKREERQANEDTRLRQLAAEKERSKQNAELEAKAAREELLRRAESAREEAEIAAKKKQEQTSNKEKIKDLLK